MYVAISVLQVESSGWTDRFPDVQSASVLGSRCSSPPCSIPANRCEIRDSARWNRLARGRQARAAVREGLASGARAHAGTGQGRPADPSILTQSGKAHAGWPEGLPMIREDPSIARSREGIAGARDGMALSHEVIVHVHERIAGSHEVMRCVPEVIALAQEEIRDRHEQMAQR